MRTDGERFHIGSRVPTSFATSSFSNRRYSQFALFILVVCCLKSRSFITNKAFAFLASGVFLFCFRSDDFHPGYKQCK